ncbi:LexA family transcriptional regulator [Pedobacter sp. SYP-B3415]|uniref:LexA family protein n=1 Tax=Pedobacter sp. SYP-B3415 TaxID=2496641 RepID=UPI00101BA584|nr:S24 family peptidase [Pedobacter sp. SYP-B3415]
MDGKIFDVQRASGFSSPAEDYLEPRLEIATWLVTNPQATFYFRMTGDALVQRGIYDQDILVVDRSANALHGCLVIAVVDKDFVCRTLILRDGSYYLAADEDLIAVQGNEIWGVVTAACRRLLPHVLQKGGLAGVCAL